MLTGRRAAAINAAHLFLNKALNALVPFFLIPLFNEIFGVEAYGELIFVQAIATLLVYVTDYGFAVTATREVSIHSGDADRLSALVSSVLVIKLLLTSAVLVALIATTSLLRLPPSAVLLYCLSFSAMALQNFMPSWFFQGLKRNVVITLTNLISKVLLIGLVLVLIGEGSPLWMVPLIDCVSYFVFFAAGLYFIFKTFSIKFSLPPYSVLGAGFLLSVDNFLITVLTWVTTGGVLLLTERFVSDQSFGYFATFTRIVYYVYAIAQPISLAMFPYVSERLARSEAEGQALLRLLMKIYLSLVVLLFVTGLAFGRHIFESFFDEAFNAGLRGQLPAFYSLVVWVSLVLLSSFVGLQFFVARRLDRTYRRLYFVNVAITVGGSLLLLPRLGTLGTGVAMSIGEAALLALLWQTYRRGRTSRT